MEHGGREDGGREDGGREDGGREGGWKGRTILDGNQNVHYYTITETLM